jgi:hypothetical protein
MQWTARGIAGAKIRRKNEICREYRRKTAAFISILADVVRCFTQFFRIFAYGKSDVIFRYLILGFE